MSFQCSVKRVFVASLCVNALDVLQSIFCFHCFHTAHIPTCQTSGDVQDIDGISACRVEWRIDSPLDCSCAETFVGHVGKDQPRIEASNKKMQTSGKRLSHIGVYHYHILSY